jgi:hypothetical protein
MNEPSDQNIQRRPAAYRAYLLRLWRTDASDAAVWRASLEDSRTGERIGFASLEQLFAFLMEQTTSHRSQ